MTWCVWITGLPGSGKSTIADRLLEMLRRQGARPCLLRLDDIRREIVPEPRYTEDERDIVYRALALMARILAGEGVPVVVDATAHRRRWREMVAVAIPRFLEVRVDCPLEVCMRREASRPEGAVMADLYRRAIERRDGLADHPGLGEVIGVDVPYEPSPDAFAIDAVGRSPAESARSILEEMRRRGWLPHGRG